MAKFNRLKNNNNFFFKYTVYTEDDCSGELCEREGEAKMRGDAQQRDLRHPLWRGRVSWDGYIGGNGNADKSQHPYIYESRRIFPILLDAAEYFFSQDNPTYQKEKICNILSITEKR